MVLPVLMAGASVISSLSGMSEARKSGRASRALMAEQLAGLRRQREQGDELYGRYQSEYAPLEGEYIAASRAGVQPDYQYGAARARYETERSFDRNAAQAQREMRRLGIDPSSPRYQSMMREIRLRRASTTAGAVNNNRMAERDRARDVGYQRLGSAVQLGRGLLNPAITSQTNANAGFGQQASVYGQQSRDAMGDVGAGLQSAGYWLNRGMGPAANPQTQPWSPSSYYLPAPAAASGMDNAYDMPSPGMMNA